MTALLGLASCAKDAGVTDAGAPGKRDKVLALSEGAGTKALEDRYALDRDDIQRGEQGNYVGGKRSQFDGKENVMFGGGVGTASYRKSTYAAPEWSGHAVARTEAYPGPTDGSRFQTPSRFQGTSPSQIDRRSRFDGQAARRSTFKADRAAENSGQRLDKPTDAWTDFRRRVYPEPLIMSKADYDRMTVEQTRSILGRDD